MEPAKHQLHLLGFVSKELNGYMVFDAKTNAWEQRECPPGETWLGPAYDRVAFEPAARLSSSASTTTSWCTSST